MYLHSATSHVLFTVSIVVVWQIQVFLLNICVFLQRSYELVLWQEYAYEFE